MQVRIPTVGGFEGQENGFSPSCTLCRYNYVLNKALANEVSCTSYACRLAVIDFASVTYSQKSLDSTNINREKEIYQIWGPC